MPDRTREGLGAFAAPSAPPAPPAEEPALPVPPPLPDPPPDEEEDDPDAPVAVPDSPSGWYRVFTPVKTFNGPRYADQNGHPTFQSGEAVVHTNEVRLSSVPGGKYRKFRLVELFARDLGYRVEPIPVGVPPVPLSTLASAGISAGVANS